MGILQVQPSKIIHELLPETLYPGLSAGTMTRERRHRPLKNEVIIESTRYRKGILAIPGGV